MKKSILNLAGAQELSKKEQKNVNGGIGSCLNRPCPTGYCCVNTLCYRTLGGC